MMGADATPDADACAGSETGTADENADRDDRRSGGRTDPGDGLVDPDVIVALVALGAIETVLLVGYLLVVPVTPTRPLYYLLPFVWLNAALLAAWRVRPAPGASRRRRLVAGTVAGGYLAVLAYVGGLVGPGLGAEATGLRLAVWSLPPGWGPAVLYGGSRVTVALLPFKTVGYAVLAYLVYLTLRDGDGALAGVFGLFSCVSCTLPVVAAVASGLVGGAGALATTALTRSYELSTLVYLVAVALLVWRPTAADLAAVFDR